MSRSRRGRFAAAGSVLVCRAAVGWPRAATPRTVPAGADRRPRGDRHADRRGQHRQHHRPACPSDFAPVVNGVEAYFSMINAEGGVDGRKLNLAYQDDDQGSPTTDLDGRPEPGGAGQRVRRGGGGDAVLRGRRLPAPSRAPRPSATRCRPTGRTARPCSPTTARSCASRAAARETRTWPSSWGPSRSPWSPTACPSRRPPARRRSTACNEFGPATCRSAT